MTMRICHVSTFSPTACGIATYTESLIENLPNLIHENVRLLYHCDLSTSNGAHELKIEDKAAYSVAAHAVNISGCDLVSLQHEFSIYGGIDGEFVVDFIKQIQKPLIVTLHTTPTFMSNSQANIIRALVAASDGTIVLTEQAKANVTNIVGDDRKLIVIRHGVRDVPFLHPTEITLRRSWGKKHVFVSAGHVSDRKGYTNTLAALAELRRFTEDFLFLIIGTHQPQFGANAQCVYSLKRMIAQYGLSDHVRFHEVYADIDALIEHILAADIGVVAYTDCQQSSSGMIPMFLGCGRPVIATPFEYATATAGRLPGLHICGGYQSNDILMTMRNVLSAWPDISTSMADIYSAMRQWIWPKVGKAYAEVFFKRFKQSKNTGPRAVSSTARSNRSPA